MVDTRPIRLQGFGLRFKTLFHAICLGIMAALRDFRTLTDRCPADRPKGLGLSSLAAEPSS